MATQVARWVTNDHKEFDTEQKAVAHERTVALLARLRPRAQGASENAAVYAAFYDAFLHAHILPFEKKVAT
jgi:hypothetical protein